MEPDNLILTTTITKEIRKMIETTSTTLTAPTGHTSSKPQAVCRECGRAFEVHKCPECLKIDSLPQKLVQFGDAVRNDAH